MNEPLTSPAPALPAPSRLATVAAGAKATALNAAGVAGPAIGFGVLGLFTGLVAFPIEWGLDLLDHPWAPWKYLVFLLLPAQAGLGALCLGWAGFWRGVGKVAVRLVQENGWVRAATEMAFAKAEEQLAATDSGSAAFERIESALAQGVELYEKAHVVEAEGRGLRKAVALRLRRWVDRKLGEQLMRLVREAPEGQRSLVAVKAWVGQTFEARVLEALRSAAARPALIWTLLWAAVLFAPPIVLGILRARA